MSEAIVTVKSIEQTNKYSKTIKFDWDAEAKPGQFIMVWCPGMDEIPLSLSSVDDEKSITFKVIGPDTEALASKSVGDKLRIRGPYGNGYDLSSKRILVVGGGIGVRENQNGRERQNVWEHYSCARFYGFGCYRV